MYSSVRSNILSWKHAVKNIEADKHNYKVIQHKFRFFFHAAVFKNGLEASTREYLDNEVIGSYNDTYNGFPVAYTAIKVFGPFHIDYSGVGYHVKGMAKLILFTPKYEKTFLTTVVDKSLFPTVEADTSGIKVRIDFGKEKFASIQNLKTVHVKLSSIKENAGTFVLETYSEESGHSTATAPAGKGKPKRKSMVIIIDESDNEPSQKRRKSEPVVIDIDSDGSLTRKQRDQLRYEKNKEEMKAKAKENYQRKKNARKAEVED